MTDKNRNVENEKPDHHLQAAAIFAHLLSPLPAEEGLRIMKRAQKKARESLDLSQDEAFEMLNHPEASQELLEQTYAEAHTLLYRRGETRKTVDTLNTRAATFLNTLGVEPPQELKKYVGSSVRAATKHLVEIGMPSDELDTAHRTRLHSEIEARLFAAVKNDAYRKFSTVSHPISEEFLGIRRPLMLGAGTQANP